MPVRVVARRPGWLVALWLTDRATLPWWSLVSTLKGRRKAPANTLHAMAHSDAKLAAMEQPWHAGCKERAAEFVPMAAGSVYGHRLDAERYRVCLNNAYGRLHINGIEPWPLCRGFVRTSDEVIGIPMQHCGSAICRREFLLESSPKASTLPPGATSSERMAE
jgi:hypothetical protein